MKKRKQGTNKVVTNDTIDNIQVNDQSDDENQGFGNWLRSSEGLEYMRLFVIANTIIVFLTMGWPQMQQAFDIITSYFNE